MPRPRLRRGLRVPARVRGAAGLARGEKVLAGCPSEDGRWLLGTRDAFVVVPDPDGPAAGELLRLPWERVERAEWSQDEWTLRVLEVGTFGEPRPEHRFSLEDPGLLLELVHERVTASVVLQRRVTVAGKRGLTVLARRPPHAEGELVWAYEFDPGVDPEDPEVRRLAEAGMQAAQEEIGA